KNERKLLYAGRDAREIGLLLEERYGFEVERLVKPGNTTKTAIKDALDRMTDKVGEKDQVVVFFSGHGVPVEEGGQVIGGFFIPVDGDKEKRSTMIPMDEITTFSKYLKAKHALFIIDTCYSAIAGGMLGKGTIEDSTPGFVASKMRRRARQIMTAGKSDEEALELTDLKMSVYSYHLKNGLKGKADQNGDGVITMSEIQVHVEKKVSAGTNFKQNPQWRDLFDTGGGEFVFVPTRFAKWAKKQDHKPAPGGWTPEVRDQQPVAPGAREILPEKKKITGDGEIYISAWKQGAAVVITNPSGEKSAKMNCPVTLENLPPGTYHARLSKPLHHDSKEIPLDVGVGVTRLDNVALDPAYGWLGVDSKPEKANVYLNERFLGKTPLPEQIVESGAYTLKLELKPWYHEHV
ncbi:MAG: PEGA domain-containing protein, partial [Desulfobacterales bacterium]|nr:PEGA domain-containing protein [Desulfobacterales bacterium]